MNSFNNLSVSWSVKAPWAQLGARLEAYAETKATISAARFCVGPGGHTTKSLPVEIFDMIAGNIKDAAYIDSIGAWLKEEKCAQRACKDRDHLTAEELEGWFKGRGPMTVEEQDAYLDAEAYEHSGEGHSDIVIALREKLFGVEGSRFARCRAVFQADFGVSPYFQWLPSYEKNNGFKPELKTIKVSGFLVVSVSEGAVEWESEALGVAYNIEQTIDLAAVLQASIGKEQQLRRTLKALRLPHTVKTTKVEFGVLGSGQMDAFSDGY